MGRSEGNYKRRDNGFYDDPERKRRWSKGSYKYNEKKIKI